MSKLPGFMFYPGDWMKDPNLRRATRSEKGLLIDLLCLMFESKDRGVLATGGVPWDDQEIVYAVGGDPSATAVELASLVRKGVLSRRADGALFSRRLVREEELRRIRTECGKKGGNPVLLNQNSTKPPTKTEANVNQNTEYENESEIVVTSRSTKKPTYQEIQTYCVQLKLTQQDAEWVFDKWEGSGWKNNGRAIADWKATIRSWQKISIFPSQRQNGNHKQNVKLSRDPARSDNSLTCACCKKSFIAAALGGFQRPCKCDLMSWCETHMQCRVCCGCTADIPPTGVKKGVAIPGLKESGRRPV